ncbi:cytidylyltransferase domain-containing protein [Marinovum sp.]|uniref:cytidylyltransferase domain-containing protein n=1 Tax=Marinovum sp. TaxID=2024839 RepID=UPI003A95477D
MRLAVIPARGGSRRIPRKNIRAFCGRPMIAWPIAAALQSGANVFPLSRFAFLIQRALRRDAEDLFATCAQDIDTAEDWRMAERLFGAPEPGR